MNKTRYLSLLAGLALFATPSLSDAQTWDGGLLAYESSQKDAQIGLAISAEDEIFAAMQALEEVEAVMDAKGVDLDALLSAAAADGQANDANATLNPAFATKAPAPAPAAIDALLTAAANDKPTIKAAPAPTYVEVAKPTPVAHIAATASPKTPTLAARPLAEKPRPKVEAPSTQAVKQNTQGLAQARPTQTTTTSTPLAIAAVPKGQSNKPRPLDLDKASNSLAMAYVASVYKVNGIDLSKASAQSGLPSIAELYQFAFKQEAVYNRSRPAIGDLAFFHNSYDRNRDGRWNDWHSLVGIVESIDQDETITVLIYDDQQIQRIKLNLKYPEVQTGRKKQTLNSQLRADEGAQKGTSSKLFGGFANLLGSAKTITVIDNWKPGL